MKKMIVLSIIMCSAFAFGVITCGAAGKKDVKRMKLTSTAFEHNGNIPKKYTCQGSNVNPPLIIQDAPKNAKSLALIVDDPDAPMGTWVHWVLYDIPLSSGIAENTAPGMHGANSSGQNKYYGPCPPSGTHHYHFKLYALDRQINLKEGLSKKELEDVMKHYIIGTAELIGLYKKE